MVVATAFEYIKNSMLGNKYIFIIICGSLHMALAKSMAYSSIISVPVSIGNPIATTFS